MRGGPSGLWLYLAGIALMVLAAVLVVLGVERHLSGAWFAFGVHPDVLAALEQGLEDQKSLAELDPERETGYRERFAELQSLTQNLRILEHSRDDLVSRYRLILLLAFGGLVVVVTAFSIAQGRRRARRLAGLQNALGDLAGGRTDIELGERRHDLIGQIAAMIERTSQVMARDRRRLRALENLSSWQEAARRHAHEMRTPLTGARLEITRLQGLLAEESLSHRDDLEHAAKSAVQELERLGRFTQAFTSFARLPRPELIDRDLYQLLDDYVTTFAEAWPRLELELAPRDGDESTIAARVDRDMLRQVLVNLCDNSALAMGDRSGRMLFVLASVGDLVILDVRDDGPGVDESVRGRLFEPYTTTRGIGEGMGLGLAISKKILLDHGGDLELHDTSPEGTTFRLTLPRAQQDGDDESAPNPNEGHHES